MEHLFQSTTCLWRCYWLPSMVTSWMSGHDTFQGRRKGAVIAFVIPSLFMSNSMTFHTVPVKSRVVAVRTFKFSRCWLLSMEADWMSGHVTLQARRKTAGIAFKLRFSFMPNSMALHVFPAKCRIIAIQAFHLHFFLFVFGSFRWLLVVPRSLNRLLV